MRTILISFELSPRAFGREGCRHDPIPRSRGAIRSNLAHPSGWDYINCDTQVIQWAASGDVMTSVRIYQPAKSAMQSGMANTRHWILEFEPSDRKQADPLMGWIGSGDTKSQVKMKFPTKEEALAFAELKGYAVRIRESHNRAHRKRGYADNFAFDRIRNT